MVATPHKWLRKSQPYKGRQVAPSGHMACMDMPNATLNGQVKYFRVHLQNQKCHMFFCKYSPTCSGDNILKLERRIPTLASTREMARISRSSAGTWPSGPMDPKNSWGGILGVTHRAFVLGYYGVEKASCVLSSIIQYCSHFGSRCNSG